ncbi:transmembrane protein 42-like [Boleophthalmus pectinirostris]|uniref:transmembrane protein 42-like n=1 Tax=Boleophthalmus pectinirostris TaxID=150288 RepID=UPI000A1C5673|nr:transmembrane protein 42-like [Boleophthalmus pectinirostris]
MVSGSLYALLAGLCGAAASLSAKLSLGASVLKQMCASGLKDWKPGVEDACDWLDIPLRVLCGGLLLVCNTVMWTFFSKALRHSSSSARVTVTTTASNFISSAVFGHVIFEETQDTLWWIGLSLTLCGLLLLHGSTSPSLQGEKEDKKDQ